tara:strand:+ start:1371 stop:1493 length:123 start_codon:yes stop_codon:yes gene_type:complete
MGKYEIQPVTKKDIVPSEIGLGKEIVGMQLCTQSLGVFWA